MLLDGTKQLQLHPRDDSQWTQQTISQDDRRVPLDQNAFSLPWRCFVCLGLLIGFDIVFGWIDSSLSESGDGLQSRS